MPVVFAVEDNETKQRRTGEGEVKGKFIPTVHQHREIMSTSGFLFIKGEVAALRGALKWPSRQT